MNKRQSILLAVIILAVIVYCWILFFELPDKTGHSAAAYIDLLKN
ncbi:hypothetical protein [Sporosarcina sp. P33]|nr:hypothetical protein [Sporosarcina sp. P33]